MSALAQLILSTGEGEAPPSELVFFWDMEQDDANIGADPPVTQEAAQYFGTAELAANPNDGGVQWLHIPNDGGFPAAYWYNNTDTNVWGATTGKGWYRFRWMYSNALVNNALVNHLNMKSEVPEFDEEHGMSIRTSLQGGTVAALKTAPTGGIDLAIPSPAIDTEFIIEYRWNSLESNPSNLRRAILYIIGPSDVRASGQQAGAVSTPPGPVWHHILIGNDTTTPQEQWIKDMEIGEDWTYDLPIDVWQDFEFDTLSQANLESRDHSPAVTWSLIGTTSRFSMSTDAQQTSPSTINLWTDTGTRGVRNDLNATASGSFGITLSNQVVGQSVGFWLRTANLAAATSARIFYTTEQTPNNLCVGLEQRNTAGQQELYIRNNAGTLSSMVNVTADTWYWVSLYAIRNATCRLEVYDTTGSLVGAQVTVTGNNTSIGNLRFGSASNYTAQAAGVYHYIDNFVWEYDGYYPLKPWET